ncbi:hypothetical protein [Roseovarius sp. MMSF_3281]|uniref:hypothetical protein n=1 Tax=Roseovarius sp. MMSF_3281 TaxID=3046694 RepID=UPI00273D2424|nr:hypothetical protein [Roseovarius sp. MMSF_3281]
MMRLLGILMVWAVLAAPTFAQSVPIRSGEHDSFTRLVLTVPPRADWTMSNDSKSPVLSFQRPFRFDVAEVFDRIPRDRLTGLRELSPGRLQLDLACACDVTMFWHAETMLVIDIADPPARRDLVTPRLRPPRDTMRQKRQAVPDTRRMIARNQWPRTRPSAALLQRQLTPPAESVRPKPPRLHPPMRQAEALSRKRQQIMEQLGRAASQGLLSPKAGLSGKAGAGAQAKPKSPAPGGGSAPQANDGPPAGKHNLLDNIRAQSSIDRDFLRHTDTMTGITSDGRACLPEAVVRVSDWGNDAPFGAQIGPLNARLFGEFDKPDEETALRLARLYVYFGFGAEARRTLRLVATPSQGRAMTMAMADILQHGKAPDASLFAGQLDCTSSVALWAALAHADLPANTPVDTDAILRGFSALPRHLRRYVGPWLSDRFLKANRPDVANRILRILERGPGPDTPEIGLAKAEAELAEGALEEAADTLDGVVEHGAEPSARALVRRIETLWREDKEISFDMAQLAGAYARETRGTDLHADLTWAQVVALAASGAFHQAFDEIDRIKEKGSMTHDALVDDVMGRLAARAEDFDFLQYALPPEDRPMTRLSPAVANATAARLLDLGFAQAAGLYLEGGVKAPNHRQRQILRARKALQTDRPRQAEAELLGLDGRDVNRLRAEARSRLGQHRAASELFASVGEDEAAELQAWLAEDWKRLAANPETDLAQVADYMTGQPEAPGTGRTAGQLRRGRDLLGQSGDIRDMLRNLLDTRGLEGPGG